MLNGAKTPCCGDKNSQKPFTNPKTAKNYSLEIIGVSLNEYQIVRKGIRFQLIQGYDCTANRGQ